MPRKSTPYPRDPSTKHVLIIDDDPIVIKMLESRLKANGYYPIIAQDAPVGLEMAMKNLPDLIILDVMMPIINGYNLCTILRVDQRTNKIPIILLTGRSEEIDKTIGQKVGANAYLTKPFLMDQLLTTIKDLLKVKDNDI